MCPSSCSQRNTVGQFAQVFPHPQLDVVAMGVAPYPDSALNVGRVGTQMEIRGLFLEEDGTDKGTQETAIKVISSMTGFFFFFFGLYCPLAT